MQNGNSPRDWVTRTTTDCDFESVLTPVVAVWLSGASLMSLYVFYVTFNILVDRNVIPLLGARANTALSNANAPPCPSRPHSAV